MKKKIIHIFTIFLLSAVVSNAQNVVVNAEIDSFQRLIGEQARIKLKVSCDIGKRLVMPVFDNYIVDGVEIVEALTPDTQLLNGNRRMTVTQEYIITSFDTALYAIPPFEVLVEGNPYYSQELAFAVYTYPVDTANVEQIYGLKEIWETPLEWVDVKSCVIYFLFLFLLSLVLAWVIVRYVNNKPIIRIIRLKPKLPAHIVALDEMERIKGDDSWRASGNSKEYYIALTDALRVYLSERFSFNATEMTTNEIIDKLLGIKDKESIKDLQELLVTADLVKFAKLNPPKNENDRNLLNAIEFINSTKPDDTNPPAGPTEKRVVHPRSARTKRLLLLSIALLSVAILSLLVLFILDLYYLLS